MTKNLKQFFLGGMLMIVLSSFSLPSNISAGEKFNSGYSSTENESLKRMRYLYQSQPWYVDGCMYWYEATVTFNWDEVNGITDVVIESEYIVQRCRSPYILASTVTLSKANYFETIAFPETGDPAMDEQLQNPEFQAQVVSGLNEQMDATIHEE